MLINYTYYVNTLLPLYSGFVSLPAQRADNYYAIGQRIKEFRKKENMTQEQLADAVNISPSHMSHIETGITKLGLSVLVGIVLFVTLPASNHPKILQIKRRYSLNYSDVLYVRLF